MSPQEYQMPITKEVGKMCKHRLERRWYRRLVELNILIIVATIILFFRSLDEIGQYFNDLSSQVEETYQESEDYDGDSEYVTDLIDNPSDVSSCRGSTDFIQP